MVYLNFLEKKKNWESLQYEILTVHNFSDTPWPRISGSYLGSLNKGVKMDSLEEISKRFGEGAKTLGLDAVVVVGGDGSMNIVSNYCRNAGIKMIGIPKTIDNDIAITDHTPGYGSAARYIAATTAEVGVDVKSLPIHVCVIEAMGRNAGWITAASALARRNPGDAPHLIYLPERVFNEEEFLEDVN